MSVLSALGLAVAGQLVDVLLRNKRQIGTIIPQVVVDEQAIDDLMITSHPVESGANITDHAVKQPSTVYMRCGWSYSGTLTNITSAGLAPGPRQAYEQLLALQASREPFDLVTGKRSYKNMLIRRLTQVTSIETENALVIDVEMQEVLIADVQGMSYSTSVSTGTAQPASVAIGQSTANDAAYQPPVNLGSKQLSDVTSAVTADQAAQAQALVP